MLADARSTAVFPQMGLVGVPEDCRSAAVFALARAAVHAATSLALVLANARPVAVLGLSSLVLMPADARPAALFALTF